MAISQKADSITKSFINEVFSNKSNLDLPINIESVVKSLGIDLVNYTFDDDISGVLVLNDPQPTIGVNQAHSKVRKRFTIAHELGHYILHKDQGNMFMDKVLFRKSSEGYTVKDEKLEREANHFAANLLMPADLIKGYLAKNEIDFYEDSDIKRMAEDFGVSSSAMTYRLINLRLVDFR
ncbi:ImmA/IrrE family metallo-endopeptidase [Albibacterium indicum]|uniref:ImmA/IrrE family metallo-endopeptidase n=1 Tax=Albibacterium indicum TaxID=2292082 RepID=UPI000E4D1717|nr:ImmA/IrrE family metallo-endopeptidase [Pedobacter indicus]